VTSPARVSTDTVLVGIDVGATKILVLVTDPSYNELGRARGPTPTTGGPPVVVQAMDDLIKDALAAAGCSRATAIGVGTPGSVERSTGVVARSPNIAGWMDPYPLGPELAKRTGAKVVIDNDVRAGMLGEYRLGAGRAFADLLGVWFGTGVGGAVILGGQLRNGVHGAGGEIGHVVVVPHGRRCGCGRLGCLEAYAGRASMERRARSLVKKGRKTELFTIMEKSGRDRVTSGVMARALEHGDVLTRRLLEEAITAAGIGIASVCNVLDLEAVVIGGGLGTRLGEPFVSAVAESMLPHLLVDGDDRVEVLPAALADDSGALGAATEAEALLAG
jgi:glucokinase